MTDQIDMSLDDIIKKNKVGKRGAGGRGSARGRGAKGARGGVRGGGNRRVSGGGRGTPNRRGGRGGTRRGGVSRSSYTRGNAEGSWSHDMYDGPRRGGVAAPTGPVKLVVSNLDFGVSDNDIQELFSEFGRLKTASVHYDKSGRSLGSADVLFDRKADAIKAMKQYNGVPLDGRPMDIKMATSEVAPATSRLGKVPVQRRSMDGNKRRSGGGRVQKPSGGRGAKRGGRGGARGGKGKKEAAPSADDLDKEMDTYMKAR